MARDLLLRASRSALLSPALRALGLAVPRLIREADVLGGDSRTRARWGAPVRVIGRAGAERDAVARALRDGDGAPAGGGGGVAAARQVLLLPRIDAPGSLASSMALFGRQLASEQSSRGGGGRLLLLASAGGGDALRARGAAAGVAALVRSLAKELAPSGTTVNGAVVVGGGDGALADGALACVLRAQASLFLAPAAAFVTGQTLEFLPPAAVPRGDPAPASAAVDAIVTGAAGGIGAAIVAELSRAGARVLCVDVPASARALSAVAAAAGGGASALPLDITAAGAGAALRAALAARAPAAPHPLRALVHCAGVTRDRQLRGMDDGRWDAVERVNYEAVLRIDAALGLHGGAAGSALCPAAGRAIYLSSISGLAGNRGQTNYAWTKGALVGYAAELGARLRAAWRPRSAAGAGDWDAPAAFAVAPGFIETQMTAKMPWMAREAGRRSAALMQGGQPEDVAAAVRALCAPGAAAACGQVLRVCGGNIVGR
jgi:3-oxoacyl-[acyl-carrier protein] reductase